MIINSSHIFSVLQNWEIINTAVLTGKQISHAMKVFVVSYAGKISDVTRQSVCQIEDDSVLKVNITTNVRIICNTNRMLVLMYIAILFNKFNY